MIIASVYLLIGLVLLSKGAASLVDGASAIASRLGVSPLFIGLTVVAFGTSLPEFFVNVVSAMRGSTDVALGNVVGSNLANILLILGITAVISPPKLAHSTVWKEIPFSLLAALAILVLANDFLIDGIATFVITRSDGVILLLFMTIFMHYLVSMALRGNGNGMENSGVEGSGPETLPASAATSQGRSVALVLLGAALLYVGGDWTVRGATAIARDLGLSDFLIAATIIAVGTSLPELVTSVKAAVRKNTDLAVGNVIGSNIFNIFWILGITAVIQPIELPAGINLDLSVLVGASLLLFLFLFVGRRHEFKRWQGWTFLVGYALYMGFIIVRG
jgi:cation:H+ antiporter